MKTKPCHSCSTKTSVAYRVRINHQKEWVFICKECCDIQRTKVGYTYGGTWKGVRH